MTSVDKKLSSTLPLSGLNIAVPEKRQLDVLSTMLEKRGAQVLRCPLVAIHDAPDPIPVQDWINRFISSPPDWLILLTGEGLRRIVKFIAVHQLDHAAFSQVLDRCNILSRGPKPVNALREIKVTPKVIVAAKPTTAGVIMTLDDTDLSNQRVAVQLYGSEANPLLIEYLKSKGAQTDTVAPYIYADEIQTGQVLELLDRIENGALQAIVFTSKAQVKRLFQVANKYTRVTALKKSLANMQIASIGPVVNEELALHQVEPTITPDEKYFMKPLVTEMVNKMSRM